MNKVRPAMSRLLATLAFVILSAIGVTSSVAQVTNDKLGEVHFPISCATVQTKFDRAVALLHNFFFPETVKAFQAIIQDDPNCAMAYWGLAMSQRPNPLVPPFPPANLKAGWEAVQRGKKASTQTPREAEYLAAIEVFYKDYETIDQARAPDSTSRRWNDSTSIIQMTLKQQSSTRWRSTKPSISTTRISQSS